MAGRSAEGARTRQRRLVASCRVPHKTRQRNCGAGGWGEENGRYMSSERPLFWSFDVRPSQSADLLKQSCPPGNCVCVCVCVCTRARASVRERRRVSQLVLQPHPPGNHHFPVHCCLTQQANKQTTKLEKAWGSGTGPVVA